MLLHASGHPLLTACGSVYPISPPLVLHMLSTVASVAGRLVLRGWLRSAPQRTGGEGGGDGTQEA